MRTTLTTTAATALAAALLTGCGSSHAEADVQFAQQMIPHHAQAVEMSEMALDTSESDDVRRLAEQIEAAQDPEIETMTGWLEEWDEDVPHTDGHDDHGSMQGMDGMMSGEDMAALDDATGADFDRLWLTMMIEHHEGAVTMAERQQEEGSYEPAVDLAADIVEAQLAEIAQMERLLR